MIDKAVKFGKVLILVSFIIILIYLLSVSSLFSSNQSDSPVENQTDGDYEFIVQVYEDNTVYVEMTQGANLTNATVQVEHDPQLSILHDQERESTQISLNEEGSSTSFDILSTQSVTGIEIRRNDEVIYTESFDPEPQDTVVGPEGIQLADIEDKRITISEGLQLNGSTLDGTNYQSLSPAVRYEWDMGDGTTYSTSQINHTYDEIGTYEASLEVYAGDSVGTETFTVTVTVQDPIDEIVAPKQAQVGEEVTFNGNESITDQAARVEWNIAGERYTERNPTITFDERGTHQVTLTARSRSGDIQIERTTILILN